MFYLTGRMEFCAAHRLYNPSLSHDVNYEAYGVCTGEHGHGHNYILEVTVRGDADPQTGVVVDINRLMEIVQEEVISKVDHKHLNIDVEMLRGVIPTAENLAVVFWNALEPAIPGCELHRLRVYETEDIFVEYRGEGSREVPRVEEATRD
jgi:6-pyruvoyltetrahydropterin/6-carboxytetrahydropterin synthase